MRRCGAMDRLRLRELLAELGLGAGAAGGSRGQCRRAQAYPASERDTRRWLAERSALGNCWTRDLETMGSMRPYQRRTRCWRTLRSILDGQQRHRCADGRTLHVRKVTRAEPALREIYDALGLDPGPEERARPRSRIHNTALCSATCPFQSTQYVDCKRLF